MLNMTEIHKYFLINEKKVKEKGREGRDSVREGWKQKTKENKQAKPENAVRESEMLLSVPNSLSIVIHKSDCLFIF